jgi:hypothetical protein
MFVRRTLTALAIGAVLAGATTSAAAAGAPEGMSTAAYRALQIRSEAMNNPHGGAVTPVSPEALEALAVRSEGLNSHGRTLYAATPAAPASAPEAFAWDDFGIGMAAAFGLVLLTGGLAAAIRTATRKQVRIPS